MLSVLATSCEHEHDTQAPDSGRNADGSPRIGHGSPTSRELKGDSGLVPPVDDLEAVRDRGALISRMEHALTLAETKALPRAGARAAPVILPIASVDPGGRSAQVTYWRWLSKDIEEGVALAPEKASRWLLSSMLLSPDQVFENETVDGIAEMGSEDYHRIAGLLLATQAALDAHPGGTWHFHSFRERDATLTDPFRNQTRVYALGTDGRSPDLEILVQDEVRRGKKKKQKVLRPASVLSMQVVHSIDDSGTLSLQLPLPSVLTVARVMASGSDATVRGSDGSTWMISGAGGVINRGQ